MGRLFWLSDEQWAVIERLLPRNKGGARRVNDRPVISGIIHVLKVGCRWCDCPRDYGPSTTVYNRFNRWSRKRFWTELVEALATSGAAPKAPPSTAPASRRTARPMAAKGGEESGYRTFARRANHQNSRPHRRDRTPFCVHADRWQCGRQPGRAALAGWSEGCAISPCGQGMTPTVCESDCASPQSPRDTWPFKSHKGNPIRRRTLQEPPPHRERLLPTERLPTRRNALRQARQKLPLRSRLGYLCCVLAMN
ncbi:transposase [Pseudorhizobium tarimense]|uniref:Transposase n=1 Tax=Pseudorhizobium tarimense TaxID=1079109 RepID=A0ABV2HBE3_9HYPH